MGILIRKSGFLSSIQDLGRYNYQDIGVSPCGAMDERSLMIANILVGNDKNDAVIETTMMGPEIEFKEDNIFAVTGGKLELKLNNEQIEMYKEIQAKKGDILSFGFMKEGCRNYIAFKGGLAVNKIMDSYSTHIRGGFGGLNGRKLIDGDEIGFRAPFKEKYDYQFKQVEPEDMPGKEVKIRVILGPEEEQFTRKGIETFISSPYKIGFDSDRMGYRMSGEVVEHTGDGNVISSVSSFGTIEIPGNGQPLILMADRPTMGGYAKLGTVISVDLSVLAQCRPNSKIYFEFIDVEAAEELYIKQYEYIESIN